MRSAAAVRVEHRVLFRHPDHQATDFSQDLTAVDRGTAARPFPRNELPVPPE